MTLVEGLIASTGSRAEVIVADNGLPPAVSSNLRTAGATVLPMGRNLGFGAAVNRGVAASRGEFLVILNDDITCGDDFIPQLVEPLGNGSDMAAGVLLQELHPTRIDSAGIVIEETLLPHDYLRGEPSSRLDVSVPPPVGPCGGAAAYKRSAFEAAGGFDEGFFAYFEDVDLALRLNARGHKCALAPGARALHRGSGTLGYNSVAKARLVARSRGYLLRKYRVLARPRLALRTVPVEIGASAVLAARHRTLAPALEEIRGWRECRVREPMPLRLATVGFLEGARRRWTRST